MSERRYAHLPSAGRPWAAFDVESPAAAAYCRRLVAQTLRFGLPAARRLGAARAALARTGVPGAVPLTLVGLRGRRPRPDLDRLVHEIGDAWPNLAGKSPTLPSEAPVLRALALHRRTALTVFLFDESRPLVVAKLPGYSERLEAEASFLEEARRSGIVPRFLGRVGKAYVQEALSGSPLRIEPLTPARAGALEWPPAHAELTCGLGRLAEQTAKQRPPEELEEPLERALAATGGETRRALEAAWRDVRPVSVAVLRHRDTSPQNCLFESDRLAGLVDWENGLSLGAPGFDILNAAVAFLEHGVGLVRWSEDRVLQTFRAAWVEGRFGEGARVAAAVTAGQAGFPEHLLGSLEIVFFGRRLGRRLADTSISATGPETAAKMLELVCAR